MAILCESHYETLRDLDNHMELAHCGNGGLAELPKVFIVDGSAIPVDIGPQRGAPAPGVTDEEKSNDR